MEKYKMLGKTTKFSAILFGMLVFFISACSTTLEAPGIRVKDFKEPSSLSPAELQAKQQNEMQEIVRLSQVKGNAVFTERNGVPEYIIGPGDILTINLWIPSSFSTGDRSRFFEEGYKQNTYTMLVRQDGKISYLFGDDIPVSGLTVNEFRTVLTKQVKTYIRNPRVELLVKEYKSKNALLFGQINILQQGTSGPGKYPLMGKTTALDLIVSAGGAISGRDAANADMRNVEIVRKGKRYTLNLYNAMFRGDITQNIILDDGDIVTVPELPTFGERVYVFGEVNYQGVYRLKDAYDLLAAIGHAGSPTAVAIKSDIKVIREYKERPGKPIILSANLDEILKRGDLAQNIKLQDGDVVYVPRQIIGDINEFILNTTPLLEYLLKYPRGYTDAYFLNPANKLRY
ncbi:MAG: polysaccharide biosynthesis/export family protein [Deltaproteobacteria bacterium]|nr:polysaccharide biosynthesis/export family protein [Deltaproteobacteria bacterium]